MKVVRLWLDKFGSKRTKFNVIWSDNGPEVAGCEELCQAFYDENYDVETTGTDASSQIGMVEQPHRHAAETV